MIRRETLLIGLGVAAGSALLASFLVGNLVATIPFGLGLGALTLQSLASRRTKAGDAERDDALLLLQAVTPKLRAGLPVDAAFLVASREAASSTADAIERYCSRAGFVVPGAVEAGGGDTGPLTRAIITMIGSCRENGGDVVTPFANLAEMIETDQRMRRRQQTATLHVRAQANGLAVIAGLVVLSIVFGSGVSVDYFRETAEGRLLMLASMTVMVWGYVVLSALNSRIGHA